MLKYSHENSKIAVRGFNFTKKNFSVGGGAGGQGGLLEKRGWLFSGGGGGCNCHILN